MIHRDKIIEGHIRARWTELEEENLKLHTELAAIAVLHTKLDEANVRAADARSAAAMQYLKDQKRIVELESCLVTDADTAARVRAKLKAGLLTAKERITKLETDLTKSYADTDRLNQLRVEHHDLSCQVEDAMVEIARLKVVVTTSAANVLALNGIAAHWEAKARKWKRKARKAQGWTK